MRYKLQNIRNDEQWQQRFKAKRFVIMRTRKHGGVACMAQEYHGDGDVIGLLCKIYNVGIIDRWTKGLLHEEGNGGPEGYESEGKDEVMVTWGSPFVLVVFKTLGLFNIFHMVASNITNIKRKLQWVQILA